MSECKNCGSADGIKHICKEPYCGFEVCSECSLEDGRCEDCARQISEERKWLAHKENEHE